MAKSEHKNTDNHWKGQERIDLARKYSKRAIEMEDKEDQDQETIDALWGNSTKNFFYALVLGHQEAPRCLALAFEEGAGVKEDSYMAALMFGVALELKDPKCATTKNMPVAPAFMKPAISAIAKLIKETQAKIPASGIDADALLAQMDIFNEKIAQESGRLISVLLIPKDAATVKKGVAYFETEHPGWVYHDAEYYQHLMDAADGEGGGAAAGGADSHLAAAFSDLHS